MNTLENIGGSVLLRKLTRKSVLWFGKHEGLRIQQIIDIRKWTYLRWIYFNCCGVTFMDDILEEIRVPDDMRIEKPGTHPELHEILREKLAKNLHFKTKSHINKVRRIQRQHKEISSRRKEIPSKAVMQACNLQRIKDK